MKEPRSVNFYLNFSLTLFLIISHGITLVYATIISNSTRLASFQPALKTSSHRSTLSHWILTQQQERCALNCVLRIK